MSNFSSQGVSVTHISVLQTRIIGGAQSVHKIGDLRYNIVHAYVQVMHFQSRCWHQHFFLKNCSLHDDCSIAIKHPKNSVGFELMNIFKVYSILAS